jgi:hypothetical protein
MMAIFVFSLEAIGRARPRSAVGAGAYRSAMQITDDRTGITYDFGSKRGVVATDVIGWAGGPDTLWNRSETAEFRCNSRTAREAIVALPHELREPQWIGLTTSLGALLRRRYGVAVHWAVHMPSDDPGADQRNIHAHVGFTVREVSANAFGRKTRILDEPRSGRYEIRYLRRAWARLVNRALYRAGHSERVDPRSFVDRGIVDRLPTIHMGRAAVALERRGIRTELGDINRHIRKVNEERMVRQGMTPGSKLTRGRVPLPRIEVERQARRRFSRDKGNGWER